jgi:hypothetical protein
MVDIAAEVEYAPILADEYAVANGKRTSEAATNKERILIGWFKDGTWAFTKLAGATYM